MVDDLTARYRVSAFTYGLDIGSQFTKYGELRVGVLAGQAEADLQVGSPILAQYAIKRDIGGVRARLYLDQLDSTSFPRDGYAVDAQILASTTRLGASDSYNRWTMTVTGAKSFGAHTFQLALAGGGAVGGPELPKYDYLTYGGFMRMTGYREGQLRNDSMSYGRLVYMNQLFKMPLLEGVYGGATLEAAHLGQPPGAQRHQRQRGLGAACSWRWTRRSARPTWRMGARRTATATSISTSANAECCGGATPLACFLLAWLGRPRLWAQAATAHTEALSSGAANCPQAAAALAHRQGERPCATRSPRCRPCWRSRRGRHDARPRAHHPAHPRAQRRHAPGLPGAHRRGWPARPRGTDRMGCANVAHAFAGAAGQRQAARRGRARAATSASSPPTTTCCRRTSRTRAIPALITRRGAPARRHGAGGRRRAGHVRRRHAGHARHGAEPVLARHDRDGHRRSR